MDGMDNTDYQGLMLRAKIFLAFATANGSMGRIAPGFSILGARYEPADANMEQLFSELGRSNGPWPVSLIILDVTRTGDASIHFINMRRCEQKNATGADEANMLSDFRGLIRAIGQSRVLTHDGGAWRFDYLGRVPMPELVIRTS